MDTARHIDKIDVYVYNVPVRQNPTRAHRASRTYLEVIVFSKSRYIIVAAILVVIGALLYACTRYWWLHALTTGGDAQTPMFVMVGLVAAFFAFLMPLFPQTEGEKRMLDKLRLTLLDLRIDSATIRLENCNRHLEELEKSDQRIEELREERNDPKTMPRRAKELDILVPHYVAVNAEHRASLEGKQKRLMQTKSRLHAKRRELLRQQVAV